MRTLKVTVYRHNDAGDVVTKDYYTYGVGFDKFGNAVFKIKDTRAIVKVPTTQLLSITGV